MPDEPSFIKTKVSVIEALEEIPHRGPVEHATEGASFDHNVTLDNVPGDVPEESAVAKPNPSSKDHFPITSVFIERGIQFAYEVTSLAVISPSQTTKLSIVPS